MHVDTQDRYNHCGSHSLLCVLFHSWLNAHMQNPKCRGLTLFQPELDVQFYVQVFKTIRENGLVWWFIHSFWPIKHKGPVASQYILEVKKRIKTYFRKTRNTMKVRVFSFTSASLSLPCSDGL